MVPLHQSAEPQRGARTVLITLNGWVAARPPLGVHGRTSPVPDCPIDASDPLEALQTPPSRWVLCCDQLARLQGRCISRGVLH